MTKKNLACVLFMVLSVRLSANAADLDLVINQNGVGPVRIKIEFKIKGNKEEFSAVARNDSDQVIANAEFCIVPTADVSICHYRFWKRNWAPDETVKWDVHGYPYPDPDLASYDVKVVALTPANPQQRNEDVSAKTPPLPSKSDGRIWETGLVQDAQSLKRDAGAIYDSTATETVQLNDTQALIIGKVFMFVVEDPGSMGWNRPGGLATKIASSVAARKHGCHVIVGDSIRFSVTGSTMHVLDVDNKECRFDIMRQERVGPKTTVPSLSKP